MYTFSKCKPLFLGVHMLGSTDKSHSKTSSNAKKNLTLEAFTTVLPLGLFLPKKATVKNKIPPG